MKNLWWRITLNRYNEGVDVGHMFARKALLKKLRAELYRVTKKKTDRQYIAGIEHAIAYIEGLPDAKR